MSIAFKCPNCQQPYKVKDDMAGKRVVCTACKKPIGVPAPTAAPAVPTHDADALAVAALAEAPASAAEEAAATITVECPNCIEQVTFPADKAGKQAPCPNCKRVIKVPIPATGKQDWRTADARPTFAKVHPSADLTDVVSTANMKIVDREALLEAGAIRKREREPLPLRTKITWGIVLGGLAVAVALGVWTFIGRKKIERRDDLVQAAVKLVKENASLPVGVRAETYRAAGEYMLAQPDQAVAAREHLAEARNALTAGNSKPFEQPFEKTALITRILLTQSGLVGEQPQIRAGARVDWTTTLKELRYTLAAIDDDPAQWEGTILAVRGLTRSLGLRGATPEQPAIVSLILQRFNNAPFERADALAAVGLELLATGDAGRTKAEDLAEIVRPITEAAGAPRVVALLTALQAGNAPKADNPQLGIRVGTAEGLARRGDLDGARKVAEAAGSPEDRFQALVAIAATQSAESAEVTTAVDFFAQEFKTRDLPDWPLIQLSQICGESKAPDPAKKLNAALAGLTTLSPQSQVRRAWAQMELLRSPHLPATAEAAKAIVPESALAHLLGWEVLGQRTAAVEGAPDAARPLALVGAALGSMK
jgi:hypothetical protein